MNFFNLITYGGAISLKEWSLVKVTGADRESFLQGQTTNDIKKLAVGSFHLNSRLTRVGKVLSFFMLFKDAESLYLLIPNELVETTISDLDKFVIMDDVEFEKMEIVPTFVIGAKSKKYKGFVGSLFEQACVMTFDKVEEKLFKDEDIEILRLISGWPKWSLDIDQNSLFNNTSLDKYAISYDKGCFLGQETVSKIHNGRGASYFPVLVEVDSIVESDFLLTEKSEKVGKINSSFKYNEKNYLHVSALREFRIDQMSINSNCGKAVVHYIPLRDESTFEKKAFELYHQAIELFQKDEEEEAKNILSLVIDLDPSFADAYESLGVILGRHEKYDEAISLMDKLLEVDEKSVMAHTNKSLYLMKLGKIEEAEAEKSLATVKSFQRFGDEAKVKKLLEEEERQKEAELLQRESMFKQVLEIDEDDTIANHGMGDICLSRGEFKIASKYLNKVIENDSKYSTAYLLLGKSYEGLGDTNSAKEIYLKGIEVASKKGDLMPANEMQTRFSKLS